MFQPLPHPNPPPQLPTPSPTNSDRSVWGKSGLDVPVQRPLKFRRRRFLFARLVGCHPADVLLGAPPCCPRCLFQQPETLPPLLTSANLMFLASQFHKYPLHHLLHETILIRQGFLFCFWFVFGVLLSLLAVLKLCLLKNSTSQPESQPASHRSFLLTSTAVCKVCKKAFLFFLLFLFSFFFRLHVSFLPHPPSPIPPHFFFVPSIDLIWKCPIAFI